MALNKEQLKLDLKQLSSDMKLLDDSDKALDEYSTRLSDIIHNYLMSAQVNPGISVSVTGTAAAQTGVTTGIGNLS